MNNRHVVTVLDSDLDAEPPYIVLEFCEYGSLRSWVQQRRTWREVATALAHALFGLRGVHGVGGFHRDLKPDNLLLAIDRDSGETVVKVADFGLARVPFTATGPMTHDGKGTIGYIAPEVMVGKPFTAAADTYSLGVVAMELLTGAIDPATPVPSTVPDEFARLVRQMLSAESAQRPPPEIIARTLNGLLQAPERRALDQAPQQPAPVAATKGAGVGAGGLLLFLGLGAAALAALAAGNDKEWDENVDRYRGPDGKFRR